jgi:predicted HTH domain antitoxin
MNRELTQRIAAEVQIFQNLEQKENFLFVLGALLARVISLKKAAEIMEMEPETFLKILDWIGLEFSYLMEEDVAIEQNWG